MDNILEKTTITLPRSMPLKDRISEVGSQIAELLKTADKVFLTKCESNDSQYIYHYSIINHGEN
jgi:hypothetical protein